MLYREWFCAGRADQLQPPGSLQVLDVAGESVLLVRTRAGELAAHYNVCRHRGSQVVPCPPVPPGAPQATPARKAGSLRCPYHSWTYRLEGDLLRAPWSEQIDGFDEAAFGLHPVGVATWGGFVFLHLTPDQAAPLADQLGPVPKRLRRYPLEALAVGRRLAYRVAANWKLVAENYNECYHCAGVHPELCRVVPAFKRGGVWLDWDRGVPHREGAWTFTATGRSDRAPFPGLDDDERTRPGFDPSDAADLWDLVNRQDWAMCESVQRGMASRAYTGGWFAPMEQPSLDIRRYVLDRLGEEA